MNELNELSLDDIFTFGKHKSHQVEDVIEDDPMYIRWLVEADVVTFDEEVMQLLSKKGIA